MSNKVVVTGAALVAEAETYEARARKLRARAATSELVLPATITHTLPHECAFRGELTLPARFKSPSLVFAQFFSASLWRSEPQLLVFAPLGVAFLTMLNFGMTLSCRCAPHRSMARLAPPSCASAHERRTGSGGLCYEAGLTHMYDVASTLLRWSCRTQHSTTCLRCATRRRISRSFVWSRRTICLWLM